MPTCGNCSKESSGEFRFCPYCGTPLGSEEPVREVRKTVTVVFSDVAGSTSLGERLDPESIRKVMGRYFEEMKAVLERHGGTVEKFIGDAVMAVFGIPQVHEDDALRAIRAASEMREALDALNTELERDLGITLSARIGLNTGEVVAGDPSTGQALVTGDAVNTAARLEQAAGPNEILIGESTYRLVRDAVESEATLPVNAKGKAAPVAAWRVIAVGEGAEGVTRRRDTPIVGRVAELRLLGDAFDRARRERACILVTVLGAAGVGKSRLVDEFLGTEGSGAAFLRGRCLPYGDGITFWPLIEMLTAAASLSGLEAADEARAKLRSLLGDASDAGAIADRLGQLLGIAGAEAVPEETFWAVRKFFEALARETPLVVDIDDLHWAEPTLLDLVEHVADWSRDAPILLVCSARPELLDDRPHWSGGKMNATSFLLAPLGDDDAAAVVGNLLGGFALPSPVLDRIESAAEGNPLFVEQTVAMLIDQGVLERTEEGWSVHDDLETLSVPPTIQALLGARLDRLAPEERAVIERAAIEGKVFHRGGVLALCDDGLRGSADRHLGALLRRDLIRPETAIFAGEDAFRFRHLLIRDAAYAGLPKEVRADLHERFAEWLERAAADRIELDEIVAFHLEQAHGLRAELGPLDDRTRATGQRAASLLIDAGDRASDRGDLTGAATLWRRAVGLLPDDDPRMPATAAATAFAVYRSSGPDLAEELLRDALARAEADASREAAVGLQVSLAMILSAADPSHHPTERIIRLHEAAERLIVSPEHRRLLGWARQAAAIGQHWLGRMSEAAKLCDRILADPTASGDRYLARVALDGVSSARLWGATPVDEALRTADRDAERAPFRELEAAVLLALHGEIGPARGTYRRALARAEELGRPVARMKVWAALVEFLDDRPDVAEHMIQEGYDYTVREGVWGFANTIAGYLARAMYENGHGVDALPLLAEHANTPQDDYEAIGLQRAAHSMILADRGDVEEAERLAREGVAALEPTEDLVRHGETLMALGHVLRVAQREEEAVDAARNALDLFERKGDVPDTGRARTFLDEAGQPIT